MTMRVALLVFTVLIASSADLRLAAAQDSAPASQSALELRQIVGDALAERLDLLTQMNMVVALDTFTPDELAALDNFYSSPVGASVISKMPRMATHLPDMMKAFMPGYLASVKAKIKTEGMEVKL
jgi:hypothetical protein